LHVSVSFLPGTGTRRGCLRIRWEGRRASRRARWRHISGWPVTGAWRTRRASLAWQATARMCVRDTHHAWAIARWSPAPPSGRTTSHRPQYRETFKGMLRRCKKWVKLHGARRVSLGRAERGYAVGTVTLTNGGIRCPLMCPLRRCRCEIAWSLPPLRARPRSTRLVICGKVVTVFARR